jgi:hypothetical protein
MVIDSPNNCDQTYKTNEDEIQKRSITQNHLRVELPTAWTVPGVILTDVIIKG